MIGKKQDQVNSFKRRRIKRRVYKRDRGYCQICWQWVPLEEATLDHYPIKRRDGGKFNDNNLRIAHKQCNWDIEEQNGQS